MRTVLWIGLLLSLVALTTSQPNSSERPLAASLASDAPAPDTKVTIGSGALKPLEIEPPAISSAGPYSSPPKPDEAAATRIAELSQQLDALQARCEELLQVNQALQERLAQQVQYVPPVAKPPTPPAPPRRTTYAAVYAAPVCTSGNCGYPSQRRGLFGRSR